VLERMCRALCEAVLDLPGSVTMLADLVTRQEKGKGENSAWRT